MTTTIHCRRCQRDAPTIVEATYPGALGAEIGTQICTDCWAEWQRAEVMVINELRLNFMDPEAQKVLVHHMREFLGLGAAEAG